MRITHTKSVLNHTKSVSCVSLFGLEIADVALIPPS